MSKVLDIYTRAGAKIELLEEPFRSDPDGTVVHWVVNMRTATDGSHEELHVFRVFCPVASNHRWVLVSGEDVPGYQQAQSDLDAFLATRGRCRRAQRILIQEVKADARH